MASWGYEKQNGEQQKQNQFLFLYFNFASFLRVFAVLRIIIFFKFQFCLSRP